jgi:predicted secreted protein
MRKDELWKLYVDKNPHWLDAGVAFTPAGLKKFFDQTFDLAHDQGMVIGRALEEKKAGKSSSSSGDLFDKLFGKF